MTDAAVKQLLAEVGALLDTMQAGEAMSRLGEAIESASPSQLTMYSPDFRYLCDRFFHKKRRELVALLERRLAGPPARRGTVPSPADRESVPINAKAIDYASRLDELRDHHIFQWNTYYRDAIGFIHKDLVLTMRLEGGGRILEQAAAELERHTREVFQAGFQYLTTTRYAVSAEVAEIKSLSGLLSFLHLLIDLYLQQRRLSLSRQDALALRLVTSSLLSAILRGYGSVLYGDRAGWVVLASSWRPWAHCLGFLTGADCHRVVESLDAADPRIEPSGLSENLLPTLVAMDRESARPAGQVLLARLSRLIGEPPRLELTFTLSNRSQLADVTIACFVDAVIDSRRALEEALTGGTAVVVASFDGEAREWVNAEGRGDLVDSSGRQMSPASHVHDLAERIAGVLSRYLVATMATPSSLLVRNYAREFPLEDPVFRRLFMVQRHSVKSLLDAFERGSGIHLWCSVRRSGKTTAAGDLAGLTAKSAVICQTMDQQPSQPETNLLYDRVLLALKQAEPLDSGFFGAVVKDCIAATALVAHGDVPTKRVLVIDEYESLFALLDAYSRRNDDLRTFVVQPLLSQMVSFARTNLLILMGQRPDAHYIALGQNQLSPLVQQDRFPLFEHYLGGLETEFAQFVGKVLSDKLPFTSGFVDSTFAETSGHPYLTVNLLVDLCDWLISRQTPLEGLQADADLFETFTRERLTLGALQRSRHYPFFQHMLSEYLGELARKREPWLHAVATVLRRIGADHHRTFSCGLQRFREISEDVAQVAGVGPDQLLTSAGMANFIETSGGQVSPSIRLMARLAASVQPRVN